MKKNMPMHERKEVRGTRRMNILFIFFLFMLTGILYRFASLQIPASLVKAKNVFLLRSDIRASYERPEIFLTDRFGATTPLAINKNFFLISINPGAVEDEEGTARDLAHILALPYENIYAKVTKENDPYEVIAQWVTDERAGAVTNLHRAGVGVEVQRGRYYPYQNSAAHVSGFLGMRDDRRIGQYGIEGFYERNMRIETSDRIIEKIILSIDPNVQFKIAGALKDAVSKWEAESGTVIIMEPETGRLLGVANYPDFDPNEYAKVTDFTVFSNQAVSGQFELGSVVKPITMAAALNERVVTPSTTYEDTGRVAISGYVIKNFDEKAHGVQTMTQVLEKSLNTGVIFAQQQLPKEIMRNYFKKFGFGEKTGVELEGEVAGNIASLERDKDLAFATASFGQGIALTPLQLVSAIATIASGGSFMKPHIIDKVIYADKSVKVYDPEPRREVISRESVKMLTDMLVETVEKGYDKVKVKNYFVAGKTGTAQVSNKDKKGYSEDETIHSFVGYAPAYHPRFAVFVMLNKPRGVRFASESLAPTFSDIMSYLLTHYEVPPDF